MLEQRTNTLTEVQNERYLYIRTLRIIFCRTLLARVFHLNADHATYIFLFRDLLKAKIDRLTSGMQSTPDFGFKFKSGASVVGSNITSTGRNGPSLTNGNTPSSDNVSEASNSGRTLLSLS